MRMIAGALALSLSVFLSLSSTASLADIRIVALKSPDRWTIHSLHNRAAEFTYWRCVGCLSQDLDV